MIELFALRHAPTDWNRDRRIQGRTDVPLSCGGEALARKWRLPDRAAGWPCLSSPLARATATARAMGLDPLPEPALIEMDWGRLEGLSLAEVRAAGGAVFTANEALGLDFRPDGGETPREVGERAFDRLRTLGGPAVIVTHKGVLRALVALAIGWDMRDRPAVRIADACCHRFALTGEGGLRLLEPNIPLDRGAPLPTVSKGHP